MAGSDTGYRHRASRRGRRQPRRRVDRSVSRHPRDRARWNGSRLPRCPPGHRATRGRQGALGAARAGPRGDEALPQRGAGGEPGPAPRPREDLRLRRDRAGHAVHPHGAARRRVALCAPPSPPREGRGDRSRRRGEDHAANRLGPDRHPRARHRSSGPQARQRDARPRRGGAQRRAGEAARLRDRQVHRRGRASDSADLAGHGDWHRSVHVARAVRRIGSDRRRLRRLLARGDALRAARWAAALPRRRSVDDAPAPLPGASAAARARAVVAGGALAARPPDARQGAFAAAHN